VTEEEAKKKWCPFARIAAGEGPAFNRLVERVTDSASASIDSPSLCIGSACMAWRNITEQRRFDATGKELTDANIFYHGAVYKDVPIGGYCGLAGQPS
jgi:hypothetical protein